MWFLSNLSKRQLAIIVFSAVVLVALPITVNLLQREEPQNQRSSAAAATALSFTPGVIQANTGDNFSLDVQVNPGSNYVSYLILDIRYDATKVAIDQSSFQVNTAAFPSMVRGPIFTDGQILAELSVGQNPTAAIKTLTKAASMSFKALSSTEGVSHINFGDQSLALSLDPSSGPYDNVIATKSPVTVTVNGATITVTPAPTSAITPTTAIPTLTTNPTMTVSPTSVLAPTGVGGPSGVPTLPITSTVAPTSNPTVRPTNPADAMSDDMLQKIKQRMQRLLENLIKKLQPLAKRIENNKRLSADQKMLLKKQLNTIIQRRQETATKIAAATSGTALREVLTDTVTKMIEDHMKTVSDLKSTADGMQSLADRLEGEGTNVNKLQRDLATLHSRVENLNKTLEKAKRSVSTADNQDELKKALIPVRQDLNRTRVDLLLIKNVLQQIAKDFEQIQRKNPGVNLTITPTNKPTTPVAPTVVPTTATTPVPTQQ